MSLLPYKRRPPFWEVFCSVGAEGLGEIHPICSNHLIGEDLTVEYSVRSIQERDFYGIGTG